MRVCVHSMFAIKIYETVLWWLLIFIRVVTNIKFLLMQNYLLFIYLLLLLFIYLFYNCLISWNLTHSFFYSILFIYTHKRLGFFFLYSIYSFSKKKVLINKSCYVYCVRVTETCHSTCMLLLFCWFWLLLLSSFVSHFGDKCLLND